MARRETWACSMLDAPCPASGCAGWGLPNGRRGFNMHCHGSCNSHFSTETTIARIAQRSVQKGHRGRCFLTAPWCSLANHGFGATLRFCPEAPGNHRLAEFPSPPTSHCVRWLRLVPPAPLHPAPSSLAVLFAQTSFMQHPFHVAEDGECARSRAVVVCVFHCPAAMYRCGWRREVRRGETGPSSAPAPVHSPASSCTATAARRRQTTGCPGAVVRHCKIHRLGFRSQRNGEWWSLTSGRPCCDGRLAPGPPSPPALTVLPGLSQPAASPNKRCWARRARRGDQGREKSSWGSVPFRLSFLPCRPQPGRV
jgi:hypothetical protein